LVFVEIADWVRNAFYSLAVVARWAGCGAVEGVWHEEETWLADGALYLEGGVEDADLASLDVAVGTRGGLERDIGAKGAGISAGTIDQILSAQAESAVETWTRGVDALLAAGRTGLAKGVVSGKSWNNHGISNRTGGNTLSEPLNGPSRTSRTLVVGWPSAVTAVSITYNTNWYRLVQVESSSTLFDADGIAGGCILKPWTWRADGAVGWAVGAISAVEVAGLAEVLGGGVVTEGTGADAWALEELKGRVAGYAFWWLGTFAGVAGAWAS